MGTGDLQSQQSPLLSSLGVEGPKWPLTLQTCGLLLWCHGGNGVEVGQVRKKNRENLQGKWPPDRLLSACRWSKEEKQRYSAEVHLRVRPEGDSALGSLP